MASSLRESVLASMELTEDDVPLNLIGSESDYDVFLANAPELLISFLSSHNIEDVYYISIHRTTRHHFRWYSMSAYSMWRKHKVSIQLLYPLGGIPHIDVWRRINFLWVDFAEGYKTL